MLIDQVRRAEAIVGSAGAPSAWDSSDLGGPAVRGATLHAAMATVLRANGNRWMSVRDLADAVNLEALYAKRDGSPVETGQIHARANNYGDMFERRDGKIRLR